MQIVLKNLNTIDLDRRTRDIIMPSQTTSRDPLDHFDDFHPLYHPTEDSISPSRSSWVGEIEKWVINGIDKELTRRWDRIIRPGHSDRPSQIPESVRSFVRDWGSRLPLSHICQHPSSLDHESWYDSMEDRPIVESFSSIGEEILDRLRSSRIIELDRDGSDGSSILQVIIERNITRLEKSKKFPDTQKFLSHQDIRSCWRKSRKNIIFCIFMKTLIAIIEKKTWFLSRDTITTRLLPALPTQLVNPFAIKTICKESNNLIYSSLVFL